MLYDWKSIRKKPLDLWKLNMLLNNNGALKKSKRKFKNTTKIGHSKTYGMQQKPFQEESL